MLGLGKGSRFEQRNGSAAANPYLIIAASLASGLYGIENKLTLPDPSEFLEKPIGFPKTLEQALDHLEASMEAKEFFGEEFIKLYITLGRHETELFQTAVTDWEWQRYFEFI